jgi:hypothetical protein
MRRAIRRWASRSSAVLAFLLTGCSGSFSIPPPGANDNRVSVTQAPLPGPSAPAIVEKETGETPAICYVRSRFGGAVLVPLSCDDARLVNIR